MATNNSGSNAWRCAVCGYIHREPEPPEWCPVCGSARTEFEPYVDEAIARPRTAERFRCLNCSHLHAGATPPENCPVCGAAVDRFEPLRDTGKTPAAGKPIKVVVVGAGIAGLSAAESLRSVSPQAEITIITKEKNLPYYRLNLTRFLAGEIEEKDLPIRRQAWFDENRISIMTGMEVAALSLPDRTVTLCGGSRLSFEKLILAAGAHPFVPPLPGMNREGVTSFRTLDDARRILAAARAGMRCIVVGGGVLGLETAGALARQGADVALLEGHGWLMPRQLSRRAGELLKEHVLGMKIKLMTNARPKELVGDERVGGILIEGGDTIPGEFVVISTGVRPNSYLARRAGLEVDTGIVVNNHLVTSHPDVLAAGDVAEHSGSLYGTWAPSQYQGSIAGMNAAGMAIEFGGIPRSNTLKVLGLDLFSIGRVEPEDGSYEVVEQESDGKYFRFVFHDTHLVGAILLGDASLTVALKNAVEKKTDFSGLRGRQPTAADVVEHLIALGK